MCCKCWSQVRQVNIAFVYATTYMCKLFSCAKIFWKKASSTPQEQVLTKVLFQFELLAPPLWRQWSVKKKREKLTRLLLPGGRETGVWEVLPHRWQHQVSKLAGHTEIIPLWSAVAKSGDCTQPKACRRETDPRRRRQPSSADVFQCPQLVTGVKWARSRSTQSEISGKQAAERVGRRDCFCPLSSLRGNGFNEVAFDWSGCCISPPPEHRPKNRKHNTSGHLCTISRALAAAAPPPSCRVYSSDSRGERQKTSVMGYMTCCDLWGYGYRLSSWVPATVCSESQEVQRSAWRYGRRHQKPPLSGGGGRRSHFICGRKLFQQAYKCAHIWKRAVWVSGCS